MKSFYSLIVVLLSVLFVGFNFSDNDKKTVKETFTKSDPWVENILKNMTIEEKAGQVVFPAFFTESKDFSKKNYDKLTSYVKDLKVGGICLFLPNPHEQAKWDNQLQALSKIPLLIGTDFENGVGRNPNLATIFPTMMGVGAANDPDLAYQMGLVLAAESKAIGVHHNYAPVVDINNNALNPIINVRSFGEEKALVSVLANQIIKGMQDGGIIATSKHFPGHGNTSSDSHNELPIISGSRDELFNLELSPFINSIDNGVMSIMVGHLAVPAFDENTNNPATLSKKITTDLLKDELGFGGLIVTDALNMHAITKKYNSGEAAVLALEAGNDVALFPDDPEEAVEGVIKALKSGRLTEERINYSVRKILLAKKWVGLDKSKYVNLNDLKNNSNYLPNKLIAQKIADKSITLVKNVGNILPLKIEKDKKYMLINLLDQEKGFDSVFNYYAARLLPNFGITRLTPKSSNKEYNTAIETAMSSDVILLSVYNKVKAFAGYLSISDNQKNLINKLVDNNKTVILAAHGNPYVLSAFPDVDAYVCNYSDVEVSEKALINSILGIIPFQGRLPISIPNTSYKYGDGIISNTEQAGVMQKTGFDRVDQIIQEAIKNKAFPGGVVLASHDSTIVYSKAFGNYTYEEGSPKVNINTIYDLASVSKVIATTSAAMICYDRKLFSLDDKVSKYIPQFALNGKDHVTIRNLLLHNAGLPAWLKLYDGDGNIDTALNKIYTAPLEFPTGTKMQYSDLGMITVGKIIEKVTGKTLDKFCKDELFEPLGMKNTGYNPPSIIKDKIAPTEIDNYWRNRLLQGEVHDETAAVLGGVAGHAGLFSNVQDLYKILYMLLNNGEFNGRKYINAETIKLFTKKHDDLSSRGLGWDTKDPEHSSAGNFFNILSYGHTGFTGTSVWTDPINKIIVVFLTNRVHPTRENNKLGAVRGQLHNAIFNAIMNK